MMKYKITSIVLHICFILFFACKQEKKATEVTDSTTAQEVTAFFVSNPQAVPEQEVTTLTIGAKAPDFNLPGTDGKFHSLSDYKNAKALVVVFTCNHCPTAQAYEDRIIKLHADYGNKGVALIAISPNATQGLLLNELGYSDLGDTFEDMILRAKDKNFDFPYLYDGDTHEASLKYGPVATPHIYVFDANQKLAYTGRLDTSEKPGTANAEDVRMALDAVLAGKPVENSVTKTFGCSIKWAWKDQYAKKINKEWAEKEVTLEELNTDGLKIVMQNNSETLRLVNLWATWCGPCVLEYPEFVDIHRMYRGRDFEFVSVSADNLNAKEKALKFLNKEGSALTNYIFSGKNKYELIEAIDPEWNGALPYTALIEPGGKIIYRKMGPIDPFTLKKTIVEHPMIGRYY